MNEPSNATRQVASWGIENPAVMASIDALGARHGPSLQLCLVTPDMLDPSLPLFELNDVLARTPDHSAMYVVKADGRIVDLNDEEER